MTDETIVRLGSQVRIRDADGTETFRIVPPEEADALADRVSADSPLGRALLGHRVGDQVAFRAPGGALVVTLGWIGN